MTHIARILASFPRQLNTEFGKIMSDPKFQKTVIKEAEDYRDDLSDDELLDRAFKDIYSAWMSDLEKRGDFTESSIYLYRGVSADKVSDIKLTGIGLYWTWDEDKAQNYSDTNYDKNLFILKASVPFTSINVRQTLKKIVWPGYDLEESERELELKKGSAVSIVSITDRKTGKNYLNKEVKGTV